MPTYVFGDNTGDDYSGTEDGRVREESATTNYGSSSTMQIAKYGASDHNHSLVKWTGISNLPSSINVTSATVSLYCTAAGGTPGVETAAIRQVLRNWVEAQFTWTIWSTGNNWTTGGAEGSGTDRGSTTLDSIDYGTATGQYYHSDDSAGLRTLSEDWASGAESNYGVHFERSDGDATFTSYIFSTAEETDGQRPYMTIIYTETSAITQMTAHLMRLRNG